MNTLQIIWDCLDIPNKENVNFVAFKVRDEGIKCFFRRSIHDGTISITEMSRDTLIQQKILKQLPTAHNFFVGFAGQEVTPVDSEWDEARQTLVVKL